MSGNHKKPTDYVAPKRELLHHAVGDNGLGRIPDEVRKSVGFAASEVGRLMNPRNGSTALFFHLIAVINQHCDPVKESPTAPMASEVPL